MFLFHFKGQRQILIYILFKNPTNMTSGIIKLKQILMDLKAVYCYPGFCFRQISCDILSGSKIVFVLIILLSEQP